MEYSIKPKSLGERRIIHYPQKRIIGLYEVAMDDKMNDVIDEVQKRLGEEYEVKRVEVMKNNDTKLKGIQVRKKDMNVAKICYWTGESVDEIVM